MGAVHALVWRVLVAGLVLGGAAGWARAQEAAAGGGADAPRGAADVSSELKPILEKHNVPGMAVLVLNGHEVVARGAAGVRKVGDPTPVTIGDRWHLGSCTKSMTATMIAGLVEEGKLSWGTTMGEVFSDLKGKMDPAWEPVTLELLLTHRAGVPSDLSKDGLWGKLWERKGTPTAQRLQLIEGVTKYPPVHKPGTEYLYANAGFAFAGAMAERVTGKGWEELMTERLFGPLGMKSAGFGAPGAEEKVEEPWGHQENGNAVGPGPRADNPAAIGPGGTVHCTIEDWGKYIALHLEGESVQAIEPAMDAKGTVLDLGTSSFVKLHMSFKGTAPEYAMGWSVSTRPWAKGSKPGDTGRVLTHNGSNTMWFCVAWLAPEKDWAVIATCNKGGGEAAKACDEAVSQMVGRYVAGK
jgi:CubicO group peptidase (beta-lactamase class C family)